MRKIDLTMTETRKYQTIKAVCNGRKTKDRACVELGLSRRQVNRLVLAYREKGKAAFRHGNRDRKPRHAITEENKAIILEKYRAYGDLKPNVVHFCELLAEEDSLLYSDTTVRKVLYQAGFLSPKTQRKTKKRLKKRLKMREKENDGLALLPKAEDFLEMPEKAHPSRPRKKFRGELLQMDASPYKWFGELETHLHVAIDDASGDVVGAYFDHQETLNGYYQVLDQILENEGIPARFLTDKRTVFTYQSKQSKKLEEDTFTQFGYACHQLGIDIKTSSIPQAKGRVERLNQTLQSRLPVDLARLGIVTLEEANRYLKTWMKRFNKTFGGKAKLSVFEEPPKPAQRNLILARVTERTVDAGHHIRFQNRFFLPVEKGQDIYFSRRTKALVIQALDGNSYLNIADKIYQTKELVEHDKHSAEFERPQELKKERRQYIPPQSHPWKLASFKNYLRKIGKSYDQYRAEKENLTQPHTSITYVSTK